MRAKNSKILLSSTLALLMMNSGCSFKKGAISELSPENLEQPSAPCHIVYDAGSSGTRLYIYEQDGEGWAEHEGPKVAALADPIREVRGKNKKDIKPVTDEVVAALDAIKQNGPENDQGKPKWMAFDWEAHCDLVSANVYATAGMRLAEQHDPETSQSLWGMLKQKLQKRVGNAVPVDTRTLTGFEEGLFAWLSVRETREDNHFGIVEMGGASSQVTFPFYGKTPDDATRTVIINSIPLQMYSYSFLGLGQDEAPKTLGFPESCAYGIGTIQQDWQPAECADKILISHPKGVRDPYNFSGTNQDIQNQLPSCQEDIDNWILTGAFEHFNEAENITSCCQEKGECYNQKNSCFRPIYLKKYLQNLNVPADSEKAQTRWTKGAVICAEEDCLSIAAEPFCRWLKNGECL